MNVARFNFSHGNHDFHRAMHAKLLAASAETGIPIATLLDTKGPEIRTGSLLNEQPISLQNGDTVVLTTDEIDGTNERFSISYKRLPSEIRPQNHILIADGVIDLEVTRVEQNEIFCVVRNGGIFGARKNVNVIGVRTSLPAVTEQDKADLCFAAEYAFDFIAASFVRKPSDVKEIREVLEANIPAGRSFPLIIAKIEDQEGLDNVDEIIRVSDGVMVARGDLGVQVPSYRVPIIQKEIIRKCNRAKKLVITATQMLDSMIRNSQPTRAEVADVANAMLDGTDAVMLSGETASGAYPIAAVQMMSQIAVETEKSSFSHVSDEIREKQISTMADTISKTAVLTAADIGADAILAPTLHGNTPKLLSKYRPEQPIVAVTPFDYVQRRLLLCYGVYPIVSPQVKNSDEMIAHAIDEAVVKQLLHPFDKVVITAGVPVNSPIMLNTIRVQILADVVGKGLRGYGETVCGQVVTAENAAEAMKKIAGVSNPILVARYMDESYFSVLPLVSGYVLEEFSSVSIEQIHAHNPDVVAIAGARHITSALTDGQIVTLDGRERLILLGKGCAGEDNDN